jgi:hypothetical protein
MNITALALRTRGGPARSKGDMPRVLAITALKFSLVDHFNLSTFNFQRLGVHQGIGDLSVRRLGNPAESRAGDAHPLGGVLLVKAFEVRQPDGFILVQRQRDNLQRGKRNTAWLEELAGRLTPYPSAAEWPGHQRIAPSFKVIMSICSQLVKRLFQAGALRFQLRTSTLAAARLSEGTLLTR